jgi:pantothenate kinase
MAGCISISPAGFAEWCIGRANVADEPRRYLLGICGPPAGGKSTLSKWLADRINAQYPATAVVVSQDGYHMTSDELKAKGLQLKKGQPHTFHAQRFVDDVRRIKTTLNETIFAPTYDRARHNPIEQGAAVVSSVRLIIVEGNYLLFRRYPWSELCKLLDETIYLNRSWKDCRPELIGRQLSKANRKGFNRSERLAVANQHVESVDHPNYDLVEASKGHANYIVSLTAWID